MCGVEFANAVEMAPVDVKFDQSGSRLAVTSLDSSLKLFDLDSSESKVKLSLLSDSNKSESKADAKQLDPWKVSFNPLNKSELYTG